jgi:hypothetical protein
MTEVAESVSPAAPTGARYLNATPRSTTIILLHPFELEGAQICEVVVRRLRGFEAKQWAQACLVAAEAGMQEPMFPGVELSAQAYAVLDDDDVFLIDEAIDAFLPARFRVLGALAEKLQGSPAGGSSPSGGQ